MNSTPTDRQSYRALQPGTGKVNSTCISIGNFLIGGMTPHIPTPMTSIKCIFQKCNVLHVLLACTQPFIYFACVVLGQASPTSFYISGNRFHTSYIQSVVECTFINIEDKRNSIKQKLSNKHNYAPNQEIFQLTQYHLYQKQKMSFASCRTAMKSGQIYISMKYFGLTFYSSLSRHIPCQ